MNATDLPARRPVTGAFLIASAVLSIIGFVVLGTQFGWPDVLDEPGTTALDAYRDAETAIRAGFYVMSLASLVMIPAAYGLQAALSRDQVAARAITAIGVLGAFAQMLGWLRWVTAVPVQSDLWEQAGTDEAARFAVATSYDTLNAYAGATLGEHLGWLLQGIWAVGVFVLAVRATGVPRWLSSVGLILSVGWAVLTPIGTAADIGWAETAGVAILYTGWYLWMALFGVVLLWRRVGPTVVETLEDPTRAEQGS